MRSDLQVTYASVPAPGDRQNEDFVLAGPDWTLVLDGATPRAGVDSGCIHTVPWLVTRVGTYLGQSLSLHPDVPLPDALERAIVATCSDHLDTCDLTNPDSPSATAAILRRRKDQLDCLVLGDSPILVDTGEVWIVQDERSAHLPAYDAETVRDHRNTDSGFWIVSTRPEAAHKAVTTSLSTNSARSLALVTDGVTRFVERLGMGTWAGLLQSLIDGGPSWLISRIRAEERRILPPESEEPSGRRVKRHDDATAALVYPNPGGGAW